MADADAVFDRIASTLAARGVVAGMMFGKRALKSGTKAIACLKGDVLAFRLGAGSAAHASALALPGAELFDPSARDKPFKDWVAVPFAHADRWPGLAETALDTLA
jgi:hypothetical protein